jgi:hypothetical protein
VENCGEDHVKVGIGSAKRVLENFNFNPLLHLPRFQKHENRGGKAQNILLLSLNPWFFYGFGERLG